VTRARPEDMTTFRRRFLSRGDEEARATRASAERFGIIPAPLILSLNLPLRPPSSAGKNQRRCRRRRHRRHRRHLLSLLRSRKGQKVVRHARRRDNELSSRTRFLGRNRKYCRTIMGDISQEPSRTALFFSLAFFPSRHLRHEDRSAERSLAPPDLILLPIILARNQRVREIGVFSFAREASAYQAESRIPARDAVNVIPVAAPSNRYFITPLSAIADRVRIRDTRRDILFAFSPSFS